MTNTTPGTDGSSQGQNVGESNGSSTTLSRDTNLDTSAMSRYQEQLILRHNKEQEKWMQKQREKELLEEQERQMLFRQTPPFRAAQAVADNVRFEKNAIRDFLQQYPTEKPTGLKWWPPNLRVGRSGLCTPCRAIDFEAAFTTPRVFYNRFQRFIHIHEQDTQSFEHVEKNSEGIDWPVNSNCQFCLYLANVVQTSPKKGKYTIVFHNEYQNHHDEVLIKVVPFSLRDAYWYLPISMHYTWESQPNLFESTFGHGSRTYSFEGMRSVSNTIICHRNRPVRKEGTAQIVSQTFDGSLAQSWYDTCKRKHAVCGMEDDIEVPKTSLIDCITRRLVSTASHHHPRPSFVALSYVWGTGLDKETRTRTDHLPVDLPLTIEDAIAVTKALGFRYLWVDQYCIDQEDKEDIHRQISQMDLIYKCADLTIIAAEGDGCDYGLPGVSDCRRDVLDPFVLDDVFTFGIHPQEVRQYWKKGRWHTRGWTFQEALLSRRLLIFSEIGAYYECKSHTDGAWQGELRGGVECGESEDSWPYSRAWADGAGVESIVGSNTLSSLVEVHDSYCESVSHKGLLESYLTYIRLVTQYTTRNLSYPGDGLNAFRGAANSLQHFEHPVYNISGIPFVVHDQGRVQDSLVEDSFLCGLAWRSKAGGLAPDPQFPSWSWANTRVWSVTWMRDEDNEEYEPMLAKTIYRAHDMRIEFGLDGNRGPRAFAEFAKAFRNPTPLSRFNGDPKALCFKSRILCSRFTSESLDWDDEYLLGNFYSDLGYGDWDVSVHVDVPSIHHQSEENGGAPHVHDPEPRCLTEIPNERLYEEVSSERRSLVLLRFDDEEASVLLVEWLEGEPDGLQRTARRVGILKIGTFHRHGEVREAQTNNFLRCFSIETDLRLI